MEYHQLSKNARQALMVHQALWGMITITIIEVISLVILAFSIPETVQIVIVAIRNLIMIYVILEWILDFTVGFKHKKYRITSESIEYVKGMIFVSRTIIPLRRIQQVELSEGVVNRHFKLANINLITAGGELEIEYLDKEVAEKLVADLKDVINQFAKEDSIIAKQQVINENFKELPQTNVAFSDETTASSVSENTLEVGD